MAEDMIPDAAWKRLTAGLLITYTQHRVEGHHTPCGQRGWGCTLEQNKPKEAVGGSLCSVKRVRCPLVPKGGCGWLV